MAYAYADYWDHRERREYLAPEADRGSVFLYLSGSILDGYNMCVDGTERQDLRLVHVHFGGDVQWQAGPSEFTVFTFLTGDGFSERKQETGSSSSSTPVGSQVGDMLFGGRYRYRDWFALSAGWLVSYTSPEESRSSSSAPATSSNESKAKFYGDRLFLDTSVPMLRIVAQNVFNLSSTGLESSRFLVQNLPLTFVAGFASAGGNYYKDEDVVTAEARLDEVGGLGYGRVEVNTGDGHVRSAHLGISTPRAFRWLRSGGVHDFGFEAFGTRFDSARVAALVGGGAVYGGRAGLQYRYTGTMLTDGKGNPLPNRWSIVLSFSWSRNRPETLSRFTDATNHDETLLEFALLPFDHDPEQAWIVYDGR